MLVAFATNGESKKKTFKNLKAIELRYYAWNLCQWVSSKFAQIKTIGSLNFLYTCMYIVKTQTNIL
jgi:hypothetical protein